jgi:hypothetical protein
MFSFNRVRSLLAALALPLLAANTITTAVQVTTATTAEAGMTRRAQKGLKFIGKGAAKLEKASSKWGKAGKIIGKNAHRVRNGTAKAGKGIGQAKKFVKRSIDKACRGKGCRKALSGARKVAKGYEKARNRIERGTEKACRAAGGSSKACSTARNVAGLVGP